MTKLITVLTRKSLRIHSLHFLCVSLSLQRFTTNAIHLQISALFNTLKAELFCFK